jgi:hypothetical protein
MKKIIGLLVVFALFAGVAFADTAEGIYVNAWGRGAFVPLQYISAQKTDGKTADGDKGETFAGVGVTWGGQSPRVDFRVGGDSEYVGFKAQMTADNGFGEGVGLTDFAYLYAKPFGTDILKLSVGMVQVDDLRGKVGDLNDGYGSFLGIGAGDEDSIFQRFFPSNGFALTSSPIDGLFFGFSVNGAIYKGWAGNGSGDWATRVYRYMQLGAGYNIAGIGHIRAQYVGGWFGEIDDTDADSYKYYESGKPARIEAAFALTAIDSLLIDLGGKFWLSEKIKSSGLETTNGVDINLGATFNAGLFGIGARASLLGLGKYTRTGSNDKSESGMNMVFRVNPKVNLDFATIGLDFALAVNGEGKNAAGDGLENNSTQIAFGAYLEKGIGKGQIKVGATYTLAPTNKDGAQGKDVFQIPIVLQYAFF